MSENATNYLELEYEHLYNVRDQKVKMLGEELAKGMGE